MLQQRYNLHGIFKPSLLWKRTFAIHAHRIPAPASPEVSRLLENYAHRPAQPLNLSKLLSFAQPITSDSVLASVAYVQTELPRRLASRINQIQALPFIVGTNPYIARTLHAYRKSFVWLATQPEVKTLEENIKFTEHLAKLVETHSNDIPTIARG
jgi:26S proteasome regulatory subunit T1